MAKLLYLVHRMPYPPDKGDKVRSYHLLQHLRQQHEVYLGTFLDDPADEAHVDVLRALCTDVCIARLHPRRAKLASLVGLLHNDALTLHYYRDTGLRRWVQQTVAQHSIDAVVVFSSSMAQYAEGLAAPVLVDFVDVDSAKWTAYADQHAWPMSWLYRREGAKLLAYERAVAATSRRSFFSTEKEAALFVQFAPECEKDVEAMGNGVDAGFFSPSAERGSPFDVDEVALVFTGAMDYWPNVDGVVWFVQQVLPRLKLAQPRLRFHIVGRSPTPAVRALAGPDVIVTGTVPDVRPYLQHAQAVVAPLRLARGIQNKVLEAMAMARPVVAAQACVEATVAQPGTEILAANDAEGYCDAILQLLRDPGRADAIGAAGRERVQRSYTWAAHMAVFDRHLAATPEAVAA